MSAYYNEIDAKAAAWLRELIRRNLIAPGDVDERSIADVRSDDLRGYTQCHFFAGIGVWSYALRRAGWDDARPVWTGSCPCQPFSVAGKGAAYADERHLWPHWHRLIRECRPATIFGEQVAAAIRTGWLDDVCLSLESLGYAVGAADFPACSVGAPHIRQRLYFVAESECEAAERHGYELGGAARGMQGSAREQRLRPDALDGGDARAVADDNGQGCNRLAPSRLHERRHGASGDGSEKGNADWAFWHDADGCGESGAVADHETVRCGQGRADDARSGAGIGSADDGGCGDLGDAECEGSQGRERSCDVELHRGARADGSIAAPGALNGFWSDAIWLPCRDGKARATQSGIEPLVDGAPARVVRLRGYGNAIVAEQARAFIEAYLEARRRTA